MYPHLAKQLKKTKPRERKQKKGKEEGRKRGRQVTHIHIFNFHVLFSIRLVS
jgi:hypothetical protein